MPFIVMAALLILAGIGKAFGGIADEDGISGCIGRLGVMIILGVIVLIILYML